MPPRRPKKPPDGAPPPVDAPQIAPECTPSQAGRSVDEASSLSFGCSKTAFST